MSDIFLEDLANAKRARQLGEWVRTFLTPQGRYRGPALTAFGFPYNQGDYIPANQRVSALRSWQAARTAQRNEAGR